MIPCNNNNYSDYKVHGTQNDRLEPSVSMQTLVLKNIHCVLRYWQKCMLVETERRVCWGAVCSRSGPLLSTPRDLCTVLTDNV